MIGRRAPRRPRDVAVTVRRTLRGPPAVVYGVLADTNRWDRLLGWSPTRYTYELGDPEDPASRVRVGHARLGKKEIRFVEEGEYWTGSFVFGERRFPARRRRRIARGFFDLRTRPADGGQTHAELRVGVTIERARAWLAVPLIYLRLWLLVRLYLGAIDRAVARGVGRGPALDDAAPSAVQARRVLIGAGAGERRATGRAGAPPARLLAARAAALADAPVPDRLKRRVVEHLAGQPDEALVQILPFELARAWGEDRRDVLRTLLHATRAGLYDLEWQIDCPACRVGADVVPRLSELRRRVHCDECDVDFDVDFAENVHATFTANPALRAVPRVVYCASSPYFRPHVHGYLTVAPGQTRELAPLPPGDVLIRARGTSRSVVVPRQHGGVVVRAGDGELEVVETAVPDRMLRAVNQGRFPARLMIERAGWAADIARGSLLLHLPDFVSHFGTEAPAAGLPLSVGTVAVLFTDIVGSTEMYHRLGDARAYALIQEHWRDAEAIAAARGGVIVKTMGDGILASFPRLADAVAAAVELMARTEAIAERHGVTFSVRAGAHEGPCFLVRAGDRLDLFGNTVNLAARLATAAGAQQLALLDDALALPGVETVIGDDGCAIERVRTPIRGLPGAFSVVLATRPDARVWSTGEHEPVAREP